MAKRKKKPFQGQAARRTVVGWGSLIAGLLGLMSRGDEVIETMPDGPSLDSPEDWSKLIEATNLAPGGAFPSEPPFQIQGEGEAPMFDMSGAHDTINWELEKEKYPEAIKNSPLLQMLVEKSRLGMGMRMRGDSGDPANYDITDIIRGLHEPEQLSQDIPSAVDFLKEGKRGGRIPGTAVLGQKGDLLGDYLGQEGGEDSKIKRAKGILAKLLGLADETEGLTDEEMDLRYYTPVPLREGHYFTPTLEEREELGY